MGDTSPRIRTVPTPLIQNVHQNRITNEGLHILQWNAKGLGSQGHGDELKIFLENSYVKPDLICIQETWFNEKSS